MSFRWEKVALSQAQGLDPISAYNKEKERADKERRERDLALRRRNEHLDDKNHSELSALIKCFNENSRECTAIILQNWDKSSEIYAFLNDNLYDIWGCAKLDYDGVMNYERSIEDSKHEIALSFVQDLCEYSGISLEGNKQKENVERE